MEKSKMMISRETTGFAPVGANLISFACFEIRETSLNPATRDLTTEVRQMK